MLGMRVLQGTGNSAVLAIGAGTLADIFDSEERGTMLGIYYAAPLLGDKDFPQRQRWLVITPLIQVRR